MTKELEHLEKLEDMANERYDSKEVYEHSIPIEEALQRLEAIENSEPSKALECLKDLRDYLIRDRVNISTTANYKVIEQALIKAQEQEKVIEIIKEKPNIVMAVKRYSTYDNFKANNINSDITQKEFELLKRYCDEKRN